MPSTVYFVKYRDGLIVNKISIDSATNSTEVILLTKCNASPLLYL
jgi:hypothetical protein